MSLASEFAPILRQGEPLAARTWFRLGGPAQYFAEPLDFEQLAALVRRCREENLPVRVLGGGSNVLVRDEGVQGVVISLTAPAFTGIQAQAPRVTAGGGAKLSHVIATSVREGLAGLESLVGIPGTIGGALHGNAGSRGGDIGQWTSRVTVMTAGGEIQECRGEDLVFAYRQSSIDELAILSAEFRLEPGDPVELTKRMQKQWIMKQAALPAGHLATGCIFKNPRGLSAGMLIDQAGLKGTRVGGAEVSDRHANFIVVDAGAKSDDVLRLIDLVRKGVLERLGVELEQQLEVW